MDIKKLISKMTVEEKASMLSGADFWHTKAVERLAIPQIMVSDGPHGLRKNDEDSANPQEAIKAVCFSTASALACSFDRNLLTAMGKALGNHKRITLICFYALSLRSKHSRRSENCAFDSCRY